MESGMTFSKPVPIEGGPHTGMVTSYAIILPFLGGGAPSKIKVIEGHVYQLADDLGRWTYRGLEVDVFTKGDGK